LPEIPIDIDAHFSESLQRRRSSYQESSFESQYGSMVDNMLNPDLVYLEQEETARDALTSLPRAFSLMAISLGMQKVEFVVKTIIIIIFYNILREIRNSGVEFRGRCSPCGVVTFI